MNVAIFGAAFLADGSTGQAEALRLGECIAHHGWTTVTGGYGGAMAAASRGAAEAGGHTIGVTCETLARAGRRKNEWVREEIRCATVRDRLCKLVEIADAYIALDGGIGTLTEIAYCWNQMQVGELKPRPVVLLGTVWQASFYAFFRAAGTYLKEEEKTMLQFATSVDEAVEQLAS
jgi:uncharacterized protein (TIGR00730 family)